MKVLRMAAAALLLAASVISAVAQDATDERVQLSRAVGTVLGSALRSSLSDVQRLGIDVDRDVLMQTIVDVLDGKSTGMTRDEANMLVEDYINRNYRQAPDTVSVASQEEFLAKAAAAEGAVRTLSGLVFQVITEGEGDMPQLDNHVAITYEGRLSDGTVFDVTDDGPVVFDLVNLTPGFREGLMMMRPGGSYRLTIPAELSYGARGIQGIIPGNAALQFDVHLIEVKP